MMGVPIGEAYKFGFATAYEQAAEPGLIMGVQLADQSDAKCVV